MCCVHVLCAHDCTPSPTRDLNTLHVHVAARPTCTCGWSQVDLGSDTVFTLKRKVLAKDPVPVEVQRLVFGGRVLANTDPLHSIPNFVAGCTVQVSAVSVVGGLGGAKWV
jgi:hypothetical protein